jgi:multidrug efflux pump subunit AcrA (membrane-fusion protein)
MRVPTLPSASAASWAGLRGAAAAFGWRRAAISVAVLLGAGFAGLKGYEQVRPTAAPAAPVQTAAVAKRTIVERVSLPGTAASSRTAKLSFSASSSGVSVSGTVKSIAVRTGDAVKAGQEVARLDTTSLDLAVQASRSSLAVAQLRMQTLLSGALPPDAAAAEQSVVSASAAYAKAVNDLNVLQGGATAGDLATATQALLTAQNSLNTAQSALDALQARAQAFGVSTEAQRTTSQMQTQQAAARSDLDRAWERITTERGFAAGQRSALSDLETAIRGRCSLQGNPEACTTAALGAKDVAGLVTAVNDATPKMPTDLAPLLKTFIDAAASDMAMIGDPSFKLLQSVAALPGLNQRVNNAVLSLGGSAGVPSADALASAVRTRDAAAAATQAAQAKVNALVQGPSGSDTLVARNAVETTKAALDSARLKRDQVISGPLASDVALQEQSVVQAEIALRRALNDQAGAALLAPFDGTVGTITMNVGEPSGTGSIILIDPKSMQLNATSQEADVAKLKVGQNVSLTFDAFQGQPVTGRVASIAPAADVVQGVSSYAVVIEVLQQAARAGAPSLDLKAGMAGTAGVEIQRIENVLAVPSRAVKRQGRAQVVQVLTANGTQEARTIRTGATDGTFSQVLDGLQEGEQVVLPTTGTTTTVATGTAAAGSGAGGGPGFGPPPGGPGGGG